MISTSYSLYLFEALTYYC